jgi:hypothetical protein
VDIVVGTNAAGGVDHSCVIVKPVFLANGNLDPNKTIVNTKNGNNKETEMTLAAMQALYNALGTVLWTYYTRK